MLVVAAMKKAPLSPVLIVNCFDAKCIFFLSFFSSTAFSETNNLCEFL